MVLRFSVSLQRSVQHEPQRGQRLLEPREPAQGIHLPVGSSCGWARVAGLSGRWGTRRGSGLGSSEYGEWAAAGVEEAWEGCSQRCDEDREGDGGGGEGGGDGRAGGPCDNERGRGRAGRRAGERGPQGLSDDRSDGVCSAGTEGAGLARDDLDLGAGMLTVSWQLKILDSRPPSKPHPKSSACVRTMAPDPATVDALREHRRHQLEERIAAGPAWQDELIDHLRTSRTGLVFT